MSVFWVAFTIAFLSVVCIVLTVVTITQRNAIKSLIKYYDARVDYLDYRNADNLRELGLANEALDIYRKLSNRLVLVHTSTNYIHLKVASNYHGGGDREKAIAAILSVIEDKLP